MLERQLETITYRICKRCVMDTSDPQISFDDAGVCNHCKTHADAVRSKKWMPGETGRAYLEAWVARIKQDQAHRQYDCIIGLSGGVDSSYLAVVARRLGLRCLAVHVDAGWNSEIAVGNIEQLLRRLDMDLVTKVVDWEEMRDLQVAFLKARVPNQDIPQDHSFFSFLYQESRRWGIKYQLQGRNYASESVLPGAWGYSAMDGIHLKAIHARYGRRPLRRYRVMSTLQYVDYYAGLPWRSKLEIVDPLNFMDYDPRAARIELTRDFGWRDYGEKHWESHWTKFFQTYYLPKRFGYDKRRAHLASLVLAGTLTREAALRELQQPPYDEDTIDRDLAFIRRKLGLSAIEWQEIMEGSVQQHSAYPLGARTIDRWMRAAAVARRLQQLSPLELVGITKRRFNRWRQRTRMT